MNDFLHKLWEQSFQPLEILGYVGQFVFFMRFVVQWIASERKKESVIPEAFWWISIGGGAITFFYGLFKPAPPIVVAQLCANVIYIRNLVLVRRMKERLATETPKA